MRALVQPVALRYTLFNAPWALISSLSFGLSNYLIILALTFLYGLEAAGKYRLFVSIIELLAIFSLLDTSKIIVKNLVLSKRGVVRPLIIHRAKWSLLGTVTGCVVAAVFFSNGSDTWIAILVASLLLPLTYPTDAYSDINQARKQFRTNALYNLAKFSTLAAVAVLMGMSGISVLWYMVAYFALMATFNIVFVTRYEETFEAPTAEAGDLKRQSVQLSAAGVLPLLLEQADKPLISYFFGLEALGLYTIGVSTGRLFLHCVKPLLTIYFPLLVNNRPTPQLLLAIAGALTLAGGAAAWLLQLYFAGVLGPRFAGAYPMAAVCAAGLGIYAVGATVYYSSIFHRDTDMRVPTITNIITPALTLCYLLFAVAFGGTWALVLCAASYPLRELLNIIAISLLTRRFNADAQAGPVL